MRLHHCFLCLLLTVIPIFTIVNMCCATYSILYMDLSWVILVAPGPTLGGGPLCGHMIIMLGLTLRSVLMCWCASTCGVRFHMCFVVSTSLLPLFLFVFCARFLKYFCQFLQSHILSCRLICWLISCDFSICFTKLFCWFCHHLFRCWIFSHYESWGGTIVFVVLPIPSVIVI